MNPNKEERTDQRIEAVLVALRKAEPRAGMELRINAALLRASHASAPRHRWAWVRLPQLAGVSVAIASMVLLSLHLYRHYAAMPLRDRVIVTTTGPSTQQVDRSSLHAAAARTPRASAREVPHGAAIAKGFNQPAGDQWRALVPNINEVSQAHTADAEQGFPAPPLPLTEQERLLIRLVHRDDPVQLAQMAPAAREAELQRDREQVREFFKPPPMLAANFKLEPYPITGGAQ